jgi:hypothetical protein
MGNVTLTTYAENDEQYIEFTITEEFFKEEIIKQGYKNKQNFLNEYTWDNSELIYNSAKNKNSIISQKYFNNEWGELK